MVKDTTPRNKTNVDLIGIFDGYDKMSCLELLRILHSKELNEVEMYLLSEIYSLIFHSILNPNEALLLQKRLIIGCLRKIEKQERFIKSFVKQ